MRKGEVSSSLAKGVRCEGREVHEKKSGPVVATFEILASEPCGKNKEVNPVLILPTRDVRFEK
jgi:hypothetical protein